MLHLFKFIPLIIGMAGEGGGSAKDDGGEAHLIRNARSQQCGRNAVSNHYFFIYAAILTPFIVLTTIHLLFLTALKPILGGLSRYPLFQQ